MYLLFCKASDCFPYGLHIAGRTQAFILDIFFITSAKARTIFPPPPDIFFFFFLQMEKLENN